MQLERLEHFDIFLSDTEMLALPAHHQRAEAYGCVGSIQNAAQDRPRIEYFACKGSIKWKPASLSQTAKGNEGTADWAVH